MGCANTFDKDQLREKTRQTEALKHSAALATAFHHLNTDRMPRFECHVHQELQYYSPYFAIHSSLLCEEASDRTTTNHFLPTIDSTFSNAAAYSAAAYFETTHMDSSPLLDSTYHPFFTVGSNFSDASTTSTAGYSRSQSPFSVLDHQPQYDDVLLSNASFQTTIYSNPSLSSHFL
ncbi:hypothetical protein BDF20DRAFT_246646 [Mycotypha africana]|uniref:uncharacterized protein n=1 Tax=Mycotypha africana TaxID=64632 RepID=UPI0023013F7C|nr:uncharacterized protein BDF20DRAFT_246646 [Mycotypha africana]KAI8967170.1 hypothetical protein BDF20DRAFT_246646 [Mycotypha africana]